MRILPSGDKVVSTAERCGLLRSDLWSLHPSVARGISRRPRQVALSRSRVVISLVITCGLVRCPHHYTDRRGCGDMVVDVAVVTVLEVEVAV